MEKKINHKAACELPVGSDIYILEDNAYIPFTVISHTYRCDKNLTLLVRKEPLHCTAAQIDILYPDIDQDFPVSECEIINKINIYLADEYPERFSSFIESAFQTVPVRQGNDDVLSVFFLLSDEIMQESYFNEENSDKRVVFLDNNPVSWILQNRKSAYPCNG